MTDHLIAHVVDALTDPTIEYEVASQDGEGNWYTNSGVRVWPFWTGPLAVEHSIPDGWLDYLQTEAAKYIREHKSPEAKSGTDLLAKLGLLKPVEPIKRRI